MAPGTSRQASPATLGLLRAMETKAVLASYLQFCYWAKWRTRSPGHPETGEGEEVEGGLRLPGLCQLGQQSMGQCWAFTWLLGPGRGSKGLSPGSDIRLVQGLRVVEMGLIHPGETAWLGIGG